jgi:hypothetical protein
VNLEEDDVHLDPAPEAPPRLTLRRLAFAVLSLLLSIGAIAVSTPAGAYADYAVQECVPTVGLGAADAFEIRPFGAATKIAQTNDCGGWGLRNEAKGQSTNGTYVVWQINAAPHTLFKTAQTTLHYYANGGYGPMSSGSGSPGYSAVGSGAPPDHWVAPTQANTSFYAIYEQCFSAPCSSATAFGYITGFYADVQDFSAPSVGASGELLDGGMVSGVQTVKATAADSGGGARSIFVYVNGIPSAATDFCLPNYNGGYTQVKPCPDSSGPQALVLDTDHGAGWVNGANDLRICAYDAAGNQSPCLHRTVEVDNTCPASGGRAATTLDGGADVGGQLHTRAQLTSNDQPIIRGSLRDAAGNPVSGATVCLYQAIDLPDAGRELATEVRTQPSGRFATKLDAGASRTVDLVYRHNSSALSDHIELDSRVVPTLAVPRKRLTNGHSAHFSGQLPGPNADGRAVALQARAGRKWRTFKQLRTASNGRFRAKYRFTQTSGRQLYVFRALVKSQSGYPYDPGPSRKRKIVVHG